MSGLLDVDDPGACPVTRPGTTAQGPITIKCRKPAGHDGRHEGRTGKEPGMPVYWTSEVSGR